MTTDEEIFDIVNERDEVIGREKRKLVHQLGYKHRAEHVLVYNSRGKVFLQKRSIHKDTFPGAWDSSSSGHLDSGEDYDQCAIRELREEIGLIITSPPRRLFKVAACLETGQEFVWVYRLDSEGPFRLHPGEIERGDWFGPEEVDAWVANKPSEFADAFKLIWTKVRSS